MKYLILLFLALTLNAQAFDYRKPIIVDNNGLASVQLSYESGMKSDFGDVRFYNGETELDYKRQNFTSGVSASFLVDAVSPAMHAYFGDASLSYTSTWEPENEVIAHYTHEEGFTKYSNNPVLTLGANNEWDDYVIYAPVLYDVGGVTHMLYAGGDGSGSEPRHVTSIGLATSTDGGETFTKQGIVIDKANISGIGIAPFSLQEISGTYYLFVTYHTSGGAIFNAGYVTSTDLANWSDVTPLTGLAYSSHAPYVIEDPEDANGLRVYYSGNLSTTGHVRTAKASKSDPSTWTNDTAVLSGTTLYPYVKYEDGLYTMYYGKLISGGYRLLQAKSFDGVSFEGSTQVLPNGSSGQFDSGYINMPRPHNGKLYYAGRVSGVNRYEAIGFAYIDNSCGLLEWGSTSGNVGASTAFARTGNCGGYHVGNSSNRPNLHTNARGKGTYEVWIYDDMTTTSNIQNSFRILDNSNFPQIKIGVYTPTSTTKYVYRVTGGNFTASSVDRSMGWRKLSYVVGDDVKIYVDDVLVATDTSFNTNNLKQLGMYGHNSGTSYFDDYRVIGTPSAQSVVVGTERVE